MAVSISDGLARIEKEVTELKQSAEKAGKEVRRLGDELKLDPKNVALLKERVVSLNNEIEKYTAYQAKLEEQERELARVISEIKEKRKSYSKESDEYKEASAELKKYSSNHTSVQKKLDKTKEKVEGLNHSLKLANKTLENANNAADQKRLENWGKSADVAKKAAVKLTVVLTSLVAAFRKVFNEAVSQSQELYKLSRQYKTTVEDIQLYNRALQLATGESDLFTDALKTMTKGLSTIPVGRGVAYSNALRQIGLSYSDLKDKDPSEQFRKIIENLQALDDKNLASAAALTLLGESGQTVIGALQQGDEELAYYLKQAEKFAPITKENAEALTRMSFELEAVKSQVQVQAAQLAIELMPTVMSLINALKNMLMPLLKLVAKNGWLIYVVIMAILGLKLYNSIVKTALAIKAAMVAQNGLNRAMFVGKAIMGGLAAAALLAAEVMSAIAMFSSSAADSADDLANAYSGLANDTGVAVQQSYATSNEKNINVNVAVEGKGNTPVSDEAAKQIAQLTSDEVNRELGRLIKGD